MKAVLFPLPSCGASPRRCLWSLPRICGSHCCRETATTTAADSSLFSCHYQQQHHRHQQHRHYFASSPNPAFSKKRFGSNKQHRDPSQRISPAAAIQAFLETTNSRTMINQPNPSSSISSSSSSSSSSTSSFSRNQSSRERPRHDDSSTTASSPNHRQSPPPPPPLTRTDIHRLKVADLRSQLAARGLDTSGTKKVLVPRLIHVMFGNHSNASTLSSTVEKTSSSFSSSTCSESIEEDLADAHLTYFLTVKGQSGTHSNGTGIGIVLSSQMSRTDHSYDHDSDEEDRWEARQYFPRGRSGFEAFYTALVLGIRYAVRRRVKRLVVLIDHHVIYNQLIGTWKVDRDSLKPLYWNVMHMKESLDLFLVQDVSLSSRQQDTDDVNVARELAQIALATGVSLNIDDGLDPMTAADDHDNQVVPKQPDHEPEIRNPDQDDMEPMTTTTTATTTTATAAAATATATSSSDISPSSVYLLRFDGGSRGNPTGFAGAGMVLYNDKGREIWCGWTYLGRMSNNMAEYWACQLGLRNALSMGIRHILVQGDSELIVRHLNGTYQVKNATLKKLWQSTCDLLAQFQTVKVEHIYRADNERADFLANHAMNTKSSHGFDVDGNCTQELESVF